MCGGSSSRFHSQTSSRWGAYSNHSTKSDFSCISGLSSQTDSRRLQKLLTPIKQLGGVTILDILFMRLRKNLAGSSAIIIVSCSHENYAAILNHVLQKRFYQLGEQNFIFFANPILAVVGAQAQYHVDSSIRLIKRSMGTAGSAQNLFQSPIKEKIQAAGVQYICFSGTQNLFENPCDPVFLGQMVRKQKRSAGKCTMPWFQSEKMPRYYQQGHSNRYGFLHSSGFDQVASGILKDLPVALNSVIFEIGCLKELTQDYNNRLQISQRYQVIEKQEDVYDLQSKSLKRVKCYSFEKDIRCYTVCEPALLYEVPRRFHYAPVVTLHKQYSLSSAVQHHRAQLESEIARINFRESKIGK